MDDLLRSGVDYERPRHGGKALLDLIGDLRGKRILDLGCGYAPYRRAIEERGATWVGTDLAGPGCAVVADALHLPFRPGSFDGILCGAVLQYIPRPAESIAEMHRVLRPNGRLFGFVPFLEPLHGMALFHMTHMGLESLLLSGGFEPDRIFPTELGLPCQMEEIFFPKSSPAVRKLVRGVAALQVRTLLTLNRWSREVLMVIRRLPAALRRKERRQYRLLLGLRYAVGFHFIARRLDSPHATPPGYQALRGAERAPETPDRSQ